MGKDPREIRQEIERTRAELGNDLDLLNEKVNPARVMGRRVSATRTAVTGLRERVMGSAAETGSAPVTSSVGWHRARASVASSVSGRVAATPDLARRQAQGNPLAAGLIAFGVGWLAASMLPVTETEKQAAARLKDQASSLAEPVKEQLGEAAQEVAGNLQQTVQDAVSSVKGAAADATSEVQDQARHSAQQVRGTAESAASHVQGATQSATEQVKDTSRSAARRSDMPPPRPNQTRDGEPPRTPGSPPGGTLPLRSTRPTTRPTEGVDPPRTSRPAPDIRRADPQSGRPARRRQTEDLSEARVGPGVADPGPVRARKASLRP